MRKYIVGTVFGFILATAFSAHAEVVNMIGKVVDGAFPVKVNGAAVDQQAVVIDGTSYLPVRAMGDALGMDVKFDANLGIELSQKAVVKTMATPSATPPQPLMTPQEKQEQIQYVKQMIEMKNIAINGLKQSISDDEEYAKNNQDQPLLPRTEQMRKKLPELQQQLTDLETQLAQLQTP